MKWTFRALTALVFTLTAGSSRAQTPAAPAQTAPPGKVTLSYKAKVGEVVRYRSEGTLTLDAFGMKLNLEVKQVEKATVTQVEANGNITVEKETESQEQTINGIKAPPSEDKTKSTVTVKPDGTLVAYRVSGGEADAAKFQARLNAASNIFFTDKPVGVGDKWTHEVKADGSLGTENGKGEYELLALEKRGNVDTAKVKFSYKEATGNTPLGGSGTVWVELTSGDAVADETVIENVPFPVGPGMTALGNGKQTGERISGSSVGGASAANAKNEPAKEKDIDATVKDYQKIPGVVTLYRKKESGRDTIYMELREDQLDKLMMLQATASTGTAEAVVAGDPITDLVFKFVRQNDDRIVIVVPNYNFRAQEGTPLARSVKRGFADAYLDSYKIEAKQPDRKSLLINVSGLFVGDIAQITQALSAGGGGISALFGGGGASYSLDREKTFIQAVKNFPENLVVETQYNFNRAGSPRGIAALFQSGVLADPRSIPLRVNYNLFSLADSTFKPRLADPRVGFIYTDYQDFSNDGKLDQTTRYIIRWDLQKADPTAKLSAPKKPIIFWLDNAIPVEYRDAVRDGILMWNKAFEKIGYKDAIVVKQQPDDADWDHADMRYNVIRWSTTQTPPYGAVALFRVNPITGQIVNAAITVDATLVRGGKLERKFFVDPAAYFPVPGDLPAGNAGAAAAGAQKAFDPRRCDYALQAIEQAWFGWTALDLLAPLGSVPNEKEYVNGFLRSIVAHEMGHILGLFHNFAASTALTLDQLKDPAVVHEQGVTASVMDYTPFNIAALKQKGVDYYSQTVGKYDIWAMEYGYKDLGGATPDAELPALKAIASRTNEPGLAYHNDIYADSFDPHVTRFDLSADPLKFWGRTLQVNRFLLLTLGSRVPKVGDSYTEFTRIFSGLLSQYVQAASIASRYIGGQNMSRNFKGDKGEKPTLVPVDAPHQKEALNLLNTYVFSEKAFAFPKSYFSHFSANMTPNLSAFATGFGSAEFPIRDQLAAVQRNALRYVFSPVTLTRLVNNEYKASDPAQALTLPTVFNSVGATVWAEVDGRRNVDTLRRQLQRTYLDTMITLTVAPPAGAPDDAKMLAWDQLRQLKAKLEAAKRGGTAYDTYTRVHIDESLMRVTRALDARQTIGGSAAAAPSLLQLLGVGGDGVPNK